MNDQTIDVFFPPHLRRFIELPDRCSANGTTVREVIDHVESMHPGVAKYLLHENGELRQHVNVFIDQKLIRDRKELTDEVHGPCEMVIMQALSGG